MAFSHRSLNALSRKAQPYRVYEGASDKGFCVQVTPTGTKIFEQQYTLLGTLLAKEITSVHVRDVFYRLIQRCAAVQANRLRSHLRAAFQWGVYHDNNPRSVGAAILFQLDRNPVDDVPEDASVESVGDRVLSWDEIAQVWNDERLIPARGEPPCPQNKSTLPQAILAYCRTSGMPPWTPKDLRRTVKTRMGELGIPKSIRDRIQNHALVDVSTKHYDRYDYLPDKREALETWGTNLKRGLP